MAWKFERLKSKERESKGTPSVVRVQCLLVHSYLPPLPTRCPLTCQPEIAMWGLSEVAGPQVSVSSLAAERKAEMERDRQQGMCQMRFEY